MDHKLQHQPLYPKALLRLADTGGASPPAPWWAAKVVVPFSGGDRFTLVDVARPILAVRLLASAENPA